MRGAAPPDVPPPLPVASPPTAQPKHRLAKTILIAAGGLLLVIILFAAIGSHSEKAQSSKVQAAMTSALQAELSENKQKLYDKVHVAGAFGLGKAKNDMVEGMSLQWKGGHPTDNPEDLASFTVDHTLYWSTPVTSDGHTKFHDTYDCAGGTPRLVNSKVVDTNGDTVEGVTNALFDYATKEAAQALHDAFRSTPAPSP